MKSSKSGLFLMELIISILFFSLASAACIQLFSKAHVVDRRTHEQNQTVLWAQNLASLWQAEDGDLNAVYGQLIKDFSMNKDAFRISAAQESLIILFDKDFLPLTVSENNLDHELTPYYQITLANLTADTELGLKNAELVFKRLNEDFYTLPLCKHTAFERGSLDE